jgi:putative membrane-bound dehydrogenase-like protein
MFRFRLTFTILLSFVLATVRSPASPGTDANRLTYLDESDPFYVGRDFPRLTTPQWIGEPGVDAAVVLAIDDMTDPAKWEKFLRPILNRLKQIDGRAPVSIMTVSITPDDPQLQVWLKEGLSLETHTATHPCPCLTNGNLQAAADNFNRCVELMNRVPGNKPVAFRLPCCDSIDSASPRFFAEIFNHTNSAGQFLTIDSSVMNIFTPNDTSLPRDLVVDASGAEKFRKYIPFPSFVTTIEDYPYPYIIGKLCWEFPAALPSDWEAQRHHGVNNPATVADWKAALDATVLKQGTMTMIFHPHGWIRSEQLVELIDYAVQKYGRQVKFLTFREAQDRLNQNLLAGHPLRAPDGSDNGVRLLDLNNDGYMDVISSDGHQVKTRLWNPHAKNWIESSFPLSPSDGERAGPPSVVLLTKEGVRGLRFGIIRPNRVSALVHSDSVSNAWTFDGQQWLEDKALLSGLELNGKPVFTAIRKSDGQIIDRGIRLRDLDNDGRCELIIGNESQNAICSWSDSESTWKPLPYKLPPNTSIVDADGRDNGLRFIDINEDGFSDILFSNEKFFSLHLFIAKPYLGFGSGWSREVLAGKRGEFGEIPMITRNGSNNGAWFHSRELWVQNEDTAALTNFVDHRSFDTLLAGLQPPPLSPEQSLRAIHVRPGFKADLVAAEPLVQSPIAFEWGADGKLWVVEMGDYPLGIDGKGKPGGKVLFLEDTNNDGIYDKSTVFLEGLNFPTGVIPWRKGVIVSAAPEIFYAEDTDGDGKADVKKVLFTGFREGNQQHRVNGFDYGLDNWLYGANGDSGGEVLAVAALNSAKPQQSEPVNIDGRDFRFRPNTGAFETQAGEAQFGRHRDDWGNWFGNNNSIWLWHYFLPEQYLARNPHLAVRTSNRVLANYTDATRVFPVARLLQRFNDIGALGHVTSANSATPYRDDLFGQEFATSIFISEPVYNLVHREVLEPDGVSFTSHRAPDEKDSEFLASADNWFRPTMLKTGPDGALYIADMYRLVIEHPEWIPDDVKNRLDLRAGHDKGRIYRVYPASAQLRKIPRLDQLDAAGLVEALDNPNGWQRDTAQRLLVERADPNAPKPLQSLFVKASNAKVRLQALTTLDGLGAVAPDIAKSAFNDPHPAVREHGIRISESLLASPATRDEILEALIERVDDPAIRVRYQLAFSLGQSDSPRAGEALVKLALKDSDTPEIQTAVMTSAPRHLGTMLSALLEHAKQQEPPEALLDKLLGLAAAMGEEHSLARALAIAAAPTNEKFAPWQFSAVAGVLDALDRGNSSLKKLKSSAGTELKQAIDKLEPMFARARSLAKRQTPAATPTPETLPALRLLGRDLAETDQDCDLLGKLLQPQFAVSLQRAALASLRRINRKHVADLLLTNWAASSPEIRTELLAALFTRQEWIESLLSALEAKQIPAGQLGPADQQKLVKHKSASIRKRAERLLAAADADRNKVVESFQTVSTLAGDVDKGAALFKQNCSICHRPADQPQLAPDLGALADKPIETFLIAILDPNRAVETRYVNYMATTKNGREPSGIIVAETGNSITLRSQNSEETILRSDLEILTSSGLSLMPEGFEKSLTAQNLADIIAFLKKGNGPKLEAGAH